LQKGRLALVAGIAASVVCVLLLLCWQFRSELLTFLRSLKIYGIILVPIFFIIGGYIFQRDKWSASSILSLWCLIVLGISSWLCLVTLLTPSTSAAYDENATIEPYLLWIFSAEIGLMLIMFTSAISNYYKNKRLSDISSSDEKYDEDEID
jgi:surface polysaccharide O-acyltransferase-like enzyme